MIGCVPTSKQPEEGLFVREEGELEANPGCSLSVYNCISAELCQWWVSVNLPSKL